MSQVPIELSPPHSRMGGDCSIDPFFVPTNKIPCNDILKNSNFQRIKRANIEFF